MNKEQKAINRNAVVVFNKDVSAEELMKMIPDDFEGDIVIHGELIGNKDISISGNIFCETFKGQHICCVKYGDFICESDIDSMDIEVNGSFVCGGDIDSGSIKVNENFICEGNNVTSGSIQVEGKMSCKGDIISSDDIQVGNSFICEGNIDSDDIRVENNFTCIGNITSKDIQIEGKFICEGNILSDDIRVGSNFTWKGEDITSGNIVVKKTFNIVSDDGQPKTIDLNDCQLKAASIKIHKNCTINNCSSMKINCES